MADSAAELWKWGSYAAKKSKWFLNAPLRDPIVYKIMDYEVSLRRSEATGRSYHQRRGRG